MISFVSKVVEDKEMKDPYGKKEIPITKLPIQLILEYIHRTEKGFDSPYTVLLRELIHSE